MSLKTGVDRWRRREEVAAACGERGLPRERCTLYVVTYRASRFVSKPISFGIGPSSWLLPRALCSIAVSRDIREKRSNAHAERRQKKDKEEKEMVRNQEAVTVLVHYSR